MCMSFGSSATVISSNINNSNDSSSVTTAAAAVHSGSAVVSAHITGIILLTLLKRHTDMIPLLFPGKCRIVLQTHCCQEESRTNILGRCSVTVITVDTKIELREEGSAMLKHLEDKLNMCGLSLQCLSTL
jgi:hypothetical protein